MLQTEVKKTAGMFPSYGAEDYWRVIKEKTLPIEFKSQEVKNSKEGVKLVFDLTVGVDLSQPKKSELKMSKDSSKERISFGNFSSIGAIKLAMITMSLYLQLYRYRLIESILCYHACAEAFVSIKSLLGRLKTFFD